MEFPEESEKQGWSHRQMWAHSAHGRCPFMIIPLLSRDENHLLGQQVKPHTLFGTISSQEFDSKNHSFTTGIYLPALGVVRPPCVMNKIHQGPNPASFLWASLTQPQKAREETQPTTKLSSSCFSGLRILHLTSMEVL